MNLLIKAKIMIRIIKKIIFNLVKNIALLKRKILIPKDIPDNPKKILIARHDRLGDLILSLPAIYSVREAYPNAKISLLINESFKDLIDFFSFKVSIITYNKKDSFLKKIFCYFKIYFSNFDILLDLTYGDSLVSGTMAFLSFIPVRIGHEVCKHGFLFTHPVKFDISKFETDNTFNIVKHLKEVKKVDKVYPELKPDIKKVWNEKLVNLGVSNRDVVIGFNIGVSKNNLYRAWPVEYMAEVINKILDKNPDYKIVIIGSKEEEIYFIKLKEYLKYNVISFVGKTDIRDLIYLMSFLNLFVCNNTGTMQLSVLLDIPAIVINGPSSVRRWGPKDLNKHTIVKKDLDCNIDDCDGKLCAKEIYCIRGITPQEVYESFVEKFNYEQKNINNK
ncbi:MAG: glycosyltransferase family 9 protein [Bacteroidota bacterium]